MALSLAEGWSRDVFDGNRQDDCSDYKCSHHIAVSPDQWPDDVRLPDLESRFACKACGKRGADVRPDFNWHLKKGDARMSTLGALPLAIAEMPK